MLFWHLFCAGLAGRVPQALSVLLSLTGSCLLDPAKPGRAAHGADPDRLEENRGSREENVENSPRACQSLVWKLTERIGEDVCNLFAFRWLSSVLVA